MGDVGQKMSGPEASLERPFISEMALQGLVKKEQAMYRSKHPKSFDLFSKGSQQLSGVPMTWMRKWSGGFPLYLSEARGCKITDVDGQKYTDFCLGDTGAMTGHSPDAVVKAVQQRLGVQGGVTTMMPTEDAAAVSADLCRRFGSAFLWSFTLSATDANRAAIRIARYLTKRPKILVVSWCYHGSVDEAIAIRDPKSGKVTARPGNVGPPVDLAQTTRVVEFNDLTAMELELSHRDVAVVLLEPAMTNMSVILPDTGYCAKVQEMARKYGSLMLWDETHTISAGPGGCIQAWKLDPDIVVIGKSIGSGIAAGTFGLRSDIGTRLITASDVDLVDCGGVGGTLAGNALSLCAMRATLEHVLTDEAFARMLSLGRRFYEGCVNVIVKVWFVVLFFCRFVVFLLRVCFR